MDEEIKKLRDMKEYFNSFMETLYKYHSCQLTREVVFAGMIVKKALDILDAAEYSVKKYNINVQISLLRLLCDNCLAIQSAKELTLNVLMDMIQNREKVNNVMIDEEQNMSDGYLKRLVAEDYPGFDRVYKFSCEAVHFTKQAMTSSFIHDKDGRVTPHMEVGNKELKDSIITNNKSMLTVSKIMIDMLKSVCFKKEA